MIMRKRLDAGSNRPDIKRRRISGAKSNTELPSSPPPVEDAQFSDHNTVAVMDPPSIDLATPTPSASGSPSHYSGEDDDLDELRHHVGANHNDIPLKDRLRAVISQQFDVEILLKHRELQHIEDEMSKIHAMMLQMRQFSRHEPTERLIHEPAAFIDVYARYLRAPEPIALPTAQQAPTHISGYHTREAMAHLNDHYFDEIYANGRSQRASTVKSHVRLTHNSCLYHRADGVIVKLVCPTCSRSNFGSVQGFINHCRISHSLEFNSHDAAAAACGVTIDENGVCDEKTESNSSSSAVKTSAHSVPVVASTGIRLPTSQLPLTTSAQTQIQVSQISASNTASNTKKKTKITHLADYLRRKISESDADLDLDSLVAFTTEKISKVHLFEDEEDTEESDIPLSEEASPFERVLAEARKLRLNVDEIRAAAEQAAGDSTSQQFKKKKKNNGAKPLFSVGLAPASKNTVYDDQTPSNNTIRSTSPTGPTKPAYNRRIPSTPEPLATRSKSRAAIAASRPPTPPLAPGDSNTKKEMNVIGNMAKYIQLSRFF